MSDSNTALSYSPKTVLEQAKETRSQQRLTSYYARDLARKDYTLGDLLRDAERSQDALVHYLQGRLEQ